MDIDKVKIHFQAFKSHWEALQDPKVPRGLVVEAMERTLGRMAEDIRVEEVALDDLAQGSIRDYLKEKYGYTVMKPIRELPRMLGESHGS